MPRTESSLLGRPLEALTALVIRFPVATMVLSGLLAAVCVVMAQYQLRFHTSRANLLNPKSEYNRRWLSYVEEFGDQDDVVVVVTGNSRPAILPVIEEIAEAIRREPKFFQSVFYRVDGSRLRPKGLHYLKPEDKTGQLGQIEGFLSQAEPILRGNWSALNVGGQLVWTADQLAAGDPRQAMAAIQAAGASQAESLKLLVTALSQPDAYRSPWPTMPDFDSMQDDSGGGYIPTNDPRVGMLLLRLVKSKTDSFAEYADSLAALRRITVDLKSRHASDGVWIGLTGMPVMENDEMEASETAMTQSGILSFIGVALLYVAGFGCIRHPMMACIALMIPMAWGFGFIVLAVGHLNILSSAFATIVIGLGSDFGVYHIAQYLRIRARKTSTAEALLETARSVGPGITTGALSTALAFFTIALTDFPGIAELGIVAGGGILLCWIASLTTLPAMVMWSDAHRGDWKVPAPLDVYIWLRPLMERPRTVLCVYMILTALVTVGMGRLWYDHNLLNLQPVGLESVELEKRLLRQNDCSAAFAVSVARTREELLARKEKFLACPMVDSVKDIVSYLPQSDASQCAAIARINQRLANLPKDLPQIPVVSRAALDGALERLGMAMQAGGRTAEAASLARLRGLVRSLPEQEYCRRLSAFQQALGADVLGRLRTLQGVSQPEPPQLTDFPEGLVSRFVGRHGHFAMQIYTKADIWNMDAMEQFVRQVREVDPDATGNPLQIYEASRQMKRSYEKAALYALITVLAIVYFDFRSLRNTMLAMLPLGLAMLQLFGLMGLLDIPLNPANMIVLPLILGVGVDNGVHIVHDYLREPAPYRMSASTAAAIVVNTLMNIVGFGSLMVATHQGLHSLGRVLTLGMACCLLSGLMMPSLLRLLQAWTAEAPKAEVPRRTSRDMRTDSPHARPAERRQSVPIKEVTIQRRSDTPV